jgi:hypothetical protein
MQDTGSRWRIFVVAAPFRTADASIYEDTPANDSQALAQAEKLRRQGVDAHVVYRAGWTVEAVCADLRAQHERPHSGPAPVVEISHPDVRPGTALVLAVA